MRHTSLSYSIQEKKPYRQAGLFLSFSLSVRLLKYAHTGKKYSVECGNADLRMIESLSLSDSGHRPFNGGFNVHTQCFLPFCHSPQRIHDAKHNQCHRRIILVPRYLQHQNNIPKQYYSAQDSLTKLSESTCLNMT